MGEAEKADMEPRCLLVERTKFSP